ncbi:conserved hypothetical protein [Chitinophaga pinensis DSM 2588]|uniref:DsbA family dithiol-disulfide isomerase n=2 Tax=Chitinophaga pinensis TaxID=79329 RepID=A0A979GXS8_CHIPD|nr:conserved hypothetical protein [Chitinophaga pinensis DSM 2588]
MISSSMRTYKMKTLWWATCFIFFLSTCQAQNQQMKTNNPLLCDPENGICEMPGTNIEATFTTSAIKDKPVKLIYFTDPICSSCWGIEPQLRKLKMEYGQYIDIEYRMGGLLPDWSYNSGGISKPSDVAHHWDEVSRYYQMPIDGDVWLEDPLSSSYPPSIAFKAAQLQDEQKAQLFLRRIKEMVFLEKKNITKWEHLSQAASATGLDTTRLKTDIEAVGVQRFQEDLAISRQYGVRGFPTIFVTDNKGHQEKIYGSKSYAVFEDCIRKLLPTAEKKAVSPDWETLFSTFRTLTSREFAELSGQGIPESEMLLEDLHRKQQLEKLPTKNGALWISKY